MRDFVNFNHYKHLILQFEDTQTQTIGNTTSRLRTLIFHKMAPNDLPTLRMMQVVFVMLVSSLMAGIHAQDAAPTPSPVKEDNANIPVPLPKSLRGRWSNPATGHNDLIEIEVLEMSTPRDGKARVTFWPYCRKSETPLMYERKLKVWRFTAANCSGQAEQINLRVRPVEGKNRLEGWYGREGEGRSVYLEWKD